MLQTCFLGGVMRGDVKAAADECGGRFDDENDDSGSIVEEDASAAAAAATDPRERSRDKSI